MTGGSNVWWPLIAGAALCLSLLPADAAAQESKSASLAKELTQLLDQGKLDSVAAKDPGEPDRFVAALYFPGSLFVVSARYAVPALMKEKLAGRNYRDIYIDLNSASIAESKIFVSDLGANGLKFKREEHEPFDTYDQGPRQLLFDGEWRKRKMSEEEYMKSFAEADDQYAKILALLVTAAKKAS